MIRVIAAAALLGSFACSAGQLLGRDIESSAIASRQAMESAKSRSRAAPSTFDRLWFALHKATEERKELLLKGADVPDELQRRILMLRDEVSRLDPNIARAIPAR